MSTLQIRKLESGTFKHIDSIDSSFFLGKFNFKQELNKAFLVEAYGAKRREYEINDISVYDYLGAEELFTNFDDLENRLTDLGYTGIETNGIIPTAAGYISSDIDNSLVLGTDNKLFVPVSSGGGGDEFFYIHMNQYIQYVQAPTIWYSRAIGPQNVGWHATANQHTLSIGTSPTAFASQSPSVILPFDCEVSEAFVCIQNSNGNTRTLNLRFYAFDYISLNSTPANVESLLQISTLSAPENKALGTGFTIPANTFTKGQHVTTVTNQSSDLTGVAVSWEVLIKLRKI